MSHYLAVYDTLPITDTPNGPDVLTGLADGNAVDLEVLENGRFGGKSPGGNFDRREPFYDVFLLEKLLVQVLLRLRNLNPLKDLACRKEIFDRERQATPFFFFTNWYFDSVPAR
jgi:hypothetical protein